MIYSKNKITPDTLLLHISMGDNLQFVSIKQVCLLKIWAKPKVVFDLTKQLDWESTVKNLVFGILVTFCHNATRLWLASCKQWEKLHHQTWSHWHLPYIPFSFVNNVTFKIIIKMLNIIGVFVYLGLYNVNDTLRTSKHGKHLFLASPSLPLWTWL